MKLGKMDGSDMLLVEVEKGVALDGRTEPELNEQGYKAVCEVEAPSESATCTYEDYGSCWVQVWREIENEE